MIETSRYKGLVFGSFLSPETDMIFGYGVGASLVEAVKGVGPLRRSCASCLLVVGRLALLEGALEVLAIRCLRSSAPTLPKSW